MRATKIFILIIFCFLIIKETIGQTLLKCEFDSLGIATIVEQEAKFVDGEIAKYLNKIDLSETKFEQSKIKICLIIDSVGLVIPYSFNDKIVSCSNISTLEKKYYDTLKTMPKWQPAICNNRKVSSYFYINQHIDIR
jgi:hypothetical protein